MYELEWIELQQLLGYGATNTKKVLSSGLSVTKLLSLTPDEMARVGFTPSQIKRAGTLALKKEAERIYNLVSKNFIKVIPYGTREYPHRLMNIFSPPVLLYVIGDCPNFNYETVISVIGPRKISEYGKQASFSLSARLTLGGALVISGGAVGGDYYAHLGALAVGGKTVIVTGGGVLSSYLKSNDKLRNKTIKRGGALISEFAPDHVPRFKSSFHLRNRIIAGLSNAVVVIEAEVGSGTLITAHAAVDEGIDVYAMPGKPNLLQYEGTNKLIMEGAMPIISAENILEKYEGRYNKISLFSIGDISADELKRRYLINKEETAEKAKPKAKPKHKPAKEKGEDNTNPKKTDSVQTLNPTLKEVYNSVSNDGTYIDEIVEKTGFSTNEVLSALTMLEIKGLVKSLAGSRYKLN